MIVDSQLVHLLKRVAWIPQRSKKFVAPSEAKVSELPNGSAYDSGWKWLSEISFGENVAKRTEEHKKKEFAAELGFADDDELNDGKWFAQLDIETRRQLKSEYRSRTECKLPENSPANPERRSAKVADLAVDAPKEEKEMRSRPVSTVTPTVKKEIRPYLRDQYTNAGEVMVCQICQSSLPFSLPNRGPFFETVEFVPETKKVHFQNYIALCPNHAAMFKHANESKQSIRELVETRSESAIPIVLAGKAC